MVKNLSSDSDRFAFGRNWKFFLETLTQPQVDAAIQDLKEMLQVETLAGKSFLDIGSGSGLSSLAARLLEAKVVSFDLDHDSVDCTRELKSRYFPNDENWKVTEGSVLDRDFMESLGKFDIIYSWGVLHHTGDMWRAIEESVESVKRPSGLVFLALYNDQGRASRRWHRIKERYVLGGPLTRAILVAVGFFLTWSKTMVRDLVLLRPLKTWKTYSANRGMSAYRDLVDWVGGFPFEVSKPEQVISFIDQRGFRLVSLRTAGGGLGCNEYVFVAEEKR